MAPSYTAPTPPLGVPSLVWFCLNALYRHPDQLYLLNCRLNYRRELNDLDLHNVDPRVWATLVQLYDHLPSKLATYEMPLNDEHMPLLQDIPSTPHFSLITVLDLPCCTNLDDDTISQLKSLHSLAALDASGTSISTRGIHRLVCTILPRDTEDEDLPRQHRGPWPLRILRLRNCKNITSDVYTHFSKFPLLSIIDLRDTACRCLSPLPAGFHSAGPELFFHPTPLAESLSYLRQFEPALYSSPKVYTLYVGQWEYRSQRPAQGSKGTEDAVITLSWGSNKMKVSNAIEISLEQEAKENAERHDRNLEAWYAKKKDMLPTAPESIPNPRLKHPTRALPFPSVAQPVGSIPPFRMPAPFGSLPSLQGASSRITSLTPVVPTKLPRKVLPSSSTPGLSSFKEKQNPEKPSGHLSKPGPPSTSPVEFFMLYREPPSWSSLDTAINTTRLQHAQQSEKRKTSIAMRTADFASVDRTGAHANMAQRQLSNLLPRREQVRNDFGLTQSISAPVSVGSSRNPFLRKRARSPDLPVFASTSSLPPESRKTLKPMATASTFASTPELGLSASHSMKNKRSLCTSSHSFASTSDVPASIYPRKDLKPISAVPAPIFTQDILDASAKESRKAAALTEIGHKRSAPSRSLSNPVKRQSKRRPSEDPLCKAFDWNKWAKGHS